MQTTPAEPLTVAEISQRVNERVNFFSLYNATHAAVTRARRACRNGSKDDARDILRFIQMGSVIEILKAADFGELPVNVPLLEWNLKELSYEVHPQSNLTPYDETPQVLSHLESLAVGVALILKNQTRTA